MARRTSHDGPPAGVTPFRRPATRRPATTSPPETEDTPPRGYSSALRRAWASVPTLDQRIARERQDARGLLGELFRQGPLGYRLWLANSPHHRTLGVAEGLLNKARGVLGASPDEAETWAEVALALLGQLSPADYSAALLADHVAQAWEIVAVGRQHAGELAAADAALRRAAQELAAGTGDAAERARLLELRAGLARRRRRGREAESLLGRAASVLRAIGDDLGAARVLQRQSEMRWRRGDRAGATGLLFDAASLVDREREPVLAFTLDWCLALGAASLGRIAEARCFLPGLRELLRRSPERRNQLRLLWLEGAIARRAGMGPLAVELLVRAAQGLERVGEARDAARVSLELAVVHQALGNPELCLHALAAAAPQWSAGMPRCTAVMRFQGVAQAVAAGTATVRQIEDLARGLEPTGEV